MPDIQRVKDVVNWLVFQKIVKNRRDLAEKMGYTESSLSQILNEKVAISSKFINKLSIVDSRINPEWIISGLGSMLRNELNELNELNDTDPKGNAKAIMINDLNVTIAPLISQFAQAGYLCGFADVEYLEKQPLYVATQRYSGGNYVAFEIRGDSMFDNSFRSICNGDVVLGRELYKHYWTSKLHMPTVFVIVHRDEGILLKEIIDHDVDAGIITCHSYNPDKVKYPDFQLHLKDVQQLFYMKEFRRGNN